jgi:hypothetical protein
MAQKVRPNNSFKPTPLRGAAQFRRSASSHSRERGGSMRITVLLSLLSSLIIAIATNTQA